MLCGKTKSLPLYPEHEELVHRSNSAAKGDVEYQGDGKERRFIQRMIVVISANWSPKISGFKFPIV